MIAADIMTHPVFAISPETPLAQAIKLMIDHRISGVPVVDREGCLVGMLTEGDLLRRVEIGTDGETAGWLTSFLLPGREADRYVVTHGRLVGEVMTPEVVSIAEDTPLPEVVRLMRRHGIKRVPVLREGRLLGIVSRADLVRRVGEALAAPPATVDDGTIHQAILDAMDREAWAPGRMVSVSVHDGAVQLDGCLFDIRERDALGVLVANVPGVGKVENRIVCIEPYAGIVTYDPAAKG
jgi:CBS domain-containing protein